MEKCNGDEKGRQWAKWTEVSARARRSNRSISSLFGLFSVLWQKSAIIFFGFIKIRPFIFGHIFLACKIHLICICNIKYCKPNVYDWTNYCGKIGRKSEGRKNPKINGRIFKRPKKIMANFSHKAQRHKAKNRPLMGQMHLHLHALTLVHSAHR